MSNMAPDLSGLDPFINAFIAVAIVVGALISLVVIGQALSAFVATSHRARLARRASIPTYYCGLVHAH